MDQVEQGQSSVVEHETESLDRRKRDRRRAGDRRRRRWIQLLALLGLLQSGAREMYRAQLIDALPSLRYVTLPEEGRWDLVWKPEGDEIPEGATGLGGYGALLALASVGDERRAERQPWLSVATAGLSVAHAATSFRELVGELEEGRVDAFSSFDAIVSAATVPLVLPEAVRALRELVGRE